MGARPTAAGSSGSRTASRRSASRCSCPNSAPRRPGWWESRWLAPRPWPPSTAAAMWCRKSHSPTTRAGALAAGCWMAPQTTGSRRTTPTWLRLSHRLRDPVWLINGRRLDAESVGQPNEEVEQGRVVGRLGDLLVAPAGVPQPLHLLVRHPVRAGRDRAHEIEQHPLGPLQPRRVEVAVA